jgi:hypothetical protein
MENQNFNFPSSNSSNSIGNNNAQLPPMNSFTNETAAHSQSRLPPLSPDSILDRDPMDAVFSHIDQHRNTLPQHNVNHNMTQHRGSIGPNLHQQSFLPPQRPPMHYPQPTQYWHQPPHSAHFPPLTHPPPPSASHSNSSQSHCSAAPAPAPTRRQPSAQPQARRRTPAAAAAADPPQEPSRRRGRQVGASGYSKAAEKKLVEIAKVANDDGKLLGSHHWDAVADKYNEWAREHGAKIVDGTKAYKKFKQVS